jgi:hypothetical protein
MDDLSDMVSTVFLAHSGANLATHDHLNLSSIVTAAELSVQSFFMQARHPDWTPYWPPMHGRHLRHALGPMHVDAHTCYHPTVCGWACAALLTAPLLMPEQLCCWLQVEAYIKGAVNLIVTLPEEIAGLPGNVSSPSCLSQLTFPPHHATWPVPCMSQSCHAWGRKATGSTLVCPCMLCLP